MDGDTSSGSVQATRQRCRQKKLYLQCSPRTPITPSPRSGQASDANGSLTVSDTDCRAFLNLINNDSVLRAFFLQDTCCRISDKYLTAMVFVYFKRARLSCFAEFTRENFFIALYLAHHIEEESDEDRWEILPWALGRHWRKQLRCFNEKKLYFWGRMDFRGQVSRKNCEDVMRLLIQKSHPMPCSVLQRTRNSNHEHRKRRVEKQSYNPFGPLWDHKEGRAWIVLDGQDMNTMSPKLRPCQNCEESNGSAPNAK